MTGQKKMTESNDRQNDNKNDKINIFMYPSVWLQVLPKVGPLFTQKGLDFKVEYVTSIRDWNSCTPKISTLYGAYRRPSKKDTTVVPHSFTFIRRDCTLPEILNILLFCIGP